MAQLTTAQFAARLGVSRPLVRKWLAAGTIKGDPITRRMTLIDESELAKARKRRKAKGRPKTEKTLPQPKTIK